MDLSGSNTISLDDKGRITIPTEYRKDILDYCAGKMVLTNHPQKDPCLVLYVKNRFDEIVQEINKLPTNTRQDREFKRNFSGSRVLVTMNSTGRILVPQSLRQQHKLGKNLLLLGSTNFFEIWDLQTREDFYKENEDIEGHSFSNINFS